MSPLFYLLVATLCASRSHQKASAERIACSSPRLRRHVKIEWTIIADENDHKGEEYPEGIAVWFGCDAGYSLFGSRNSTCKAGKWSENDAECLLEVAQGSRSHMSAQADEFTSAHFAADGNAQTCVPFSSNEKQLSWSVDTIQAFRVRVVRIVTLHPLPNATIEIRVGPRHPSTGSKFNKLCTREQLNSLDGSTRDFFCKDDTAAGRYVSILITEPGDKHVSLCEVSVYTDSGLSIDDACGPMNSLDSESASYVFENNCVRFLGQNTYDNASLLCELDGGTLVTPTSPEFQSFLDYHVLKFFESSFEQVLVSFWVNAERANGSSSWVDGSGTTIRDVQIRTDGDGQCLVSEARSWHTESCDRQHQVICIAAPLTCGSLSLPESSSLRKAPGYKLSVNQSVSFSCEPGFEASVNSITCFSNGSLSEEPTCEAREAMRLSFSSKITNFLRSFSIFANLSARALQAIVAAFGVAFATLLSALSACCFCLCRKQQAKKISEKFQLSITSFSVHMRDLPLNNSTRLFKTPENDEKSQVDIQA